jgi:hypothetical protein
MEIRPSRIFLCQLLEEVHKEIDILISVNHQAQESLFSSFNMQFQTVLLLSYALGVYADIYNLAATIPWAPKTPASVDQSVIYNGTYYLADRSNAGIHVVSLSNNTQTSFISGFVTGFTNGTLTTSISGPNGLVVLPNRNEIYAGDGDGTIKVIDLFSNKIVANISTGSKKRADEFAYDPASGIAIATNANEVPPLVSVIDAKTRKVIGRVNITGAGSLEQPRFNAGTSTFYVSVPDIKGNEGGAVITINTTSMSIGKTIPTPQCDNAGIVFGANNQLLVSCSATQLTDFGFGASYIVDVTSSAIIHNITGVSGADQVAYSATTGYFYVTCYQYQEKGAPMPFVAVIASNGTVVQKITTDNTTAHSVAVDDKTGSFLVPVKAKGILLYSLAGSSTSGGASSTSSGTASSTAASSGAVLGQASNIVVLLGAIFFCALMI